MPLIKPIASKASNTIFKYMCLFTNDTTYSHVDILDMNGNSLSSNHHISNSSPYDYTTDDGITFHVTRGQSNNVTITPASGKALRYISMNATAVGNVTTLNADQVLTESTPVSPNFVMISYAT